MKVLENKVLRVEFASSFFPSVYKVWGREFGGVQGDGRIGVNGQYTPLGDCRFCVSREDETSLVFTVHVPHRESSYKLGFRYSLAESASVLRCVVTAEHRVKVINLSHAPLLFFTEGDYHRDSFTRVPWDSPTAPGLYWLNDLHSGSIGGAWPNSAPQNSLHAWATTQDEAGQICGFLHSSVPVKPLMSQLNRDAVHHHRAASFGMALNTLPFHIKKRWFTKQNFEVCFSREDYGSSYRSFLPDPNPLYRDADVYKIFCDGPSQDGKLPEKPVTSFAQCLELIGDRHRKNPEKKQVAYLVGWQYSGHDTGYPALDKLNERLGSREELLALIETAREKYKCIVSLHINVDDAYRDSPAWDEALLCRDTDGSPFEWEAFNGHQSYHISHTKDVEAGSVFKRLEALLKLVPIKETIHLDAFRCTNCSWEGGAFIGPLEEYYCGMLPIIDWFRARGIDVSTEGLNGMPLEPCGTFSLLWNSPGEPWEELYKEKLFYGAGKDIQYAAGRVEIKS
jgi:hypothetical protein